MSENFNFSDPDLLKIKEKVLKGERLSFDDGLILHRSYDLLGIGYLANMVREKLNDNRAYYIYNRHINYTNICENRCKFCAFSKDPDEPGAFSLSIDEIVEKAMEVSQEPVTEFHIVGGLNPKLPFSYYLDMLRQLKELFPQVHLQAFTAVEIDYFSRISGLSLEATLKELMAAGLGSLPGGGAEVFSPRVREALCPKKISGKRWLEVMEIAHQLGIKSNATMLYGHIETPEEQIDHLIKLRELQDKTQGFMSFIPLAFHPHNTQLAHMVTTTGFKDLKTLAISRLMLDNFPHIKAFWIMLGLKLAQLCLSFGVDDIDGTVMEEKITHAAGAQTAQGISRQELIQLIEEAGRIPVERDTVYNIL
jgi:aminodeoxyfutalosine synthase